MADIAEDPDSIATGTAIAGSPGVNLNLTLNGAAVSEGVASFPSPVRLLFTINVIDAAGGDTVGTFNITGTRGGLVVTESVNFTNDNTVGQTCESVYAYSTVETINFVMATAPDANLLAGNLESISYNCECDDETDYQTLQQLRNRLMVRLGYAGQVNNPPPGMADLLNDFLQSAQRLLYMKYTELRTERFFTWTMTPGIRFYDLPDNDEGCSKELNALKLSWVGIEDMNGAWLPLISGIPPVFYTGITMESLPERYEIRQCIEVFPVPDAEYKLRIKGHFKLQAFTANSDKTTIDSELVFLWALATAKAHYGHPDANNVAAMANDYLGRLVAGKHGTKRYVPGAVPIPPAVRPLMRDGYDA